MPVLNLVRSVLSPVLDRGGRGRTAVLLLALLMGSATHPGIFAFGQSAAETIVGPDGTPVFQMNEDGGLLAPGTFGSGALPADSAGTRLLWHPAKAAFRAGRVGFGMSRGMEWNESAVGAYSVAFGVNTEASGRGTAAFGQGTTASGDQSLAAGHRSTASGLRSVALGDRSTAPGQFSVALGLNTTAQAYGSVALGRWNEIGGTSTGWRGGDPLLVAGNGTGPNDRSNALLLRKNGDLTIAGTLTEHSDRRLKTDIRSLGPVGDALAQLRPVRFRFEAGTGHPPRPQIGLLAQDVRAAFPSLVREGAEGRLSLAYSRLTAVLLKGLQEQRARIDSLQRRLDRVERLARTQAELARQVKALKSKDRRTFQSALVPAGGLGGLWGPLLAIGAGLLGLVLGRWWGRRNPVSAS